MPNANTFEVAPIGQLVKWFVRSSAVSVDPFARNNRWCSYSNDLNPDTAAEYHLDAIDFLKMLGERRVKADLVLFDPPYSPRQVSEVYQQIGRKATQQDTQLAGYISKCKAAIADLITPGGVAVSCGWNSAGIGLSNGFDLERVLLVCHGGGHNDTIVTVERKNNQNHQFEFGHVEGVKFD